MSRKILVGKVEHFYSRASVAAIRLVEALSVGDTISIEKDDAVFEQKVASIQIEHTSVDKAASGDSVGIKAEQQAKEGSEVYKIV
jgi:translation elongation factor EF-1alpha